MRRILRALALAAAVAGCTSTITNSGTTTSGQGTMSATINGTNWTAKDVQASDKNGLLVVSGSNSAEVAVDFAVQASTPGTYAIDSTALGNNAEVSKGLQADSGTWMASDFQGSGSVVVATLTATGASGTFSFVAPPESTSPATGTKTVTNGKFNVTF